MTFLAFIIIKNKYLTRLFIAALFIMALSWKQPNPSTKEQTNSGLFTEKHAAPKA